MKFKDKKDFVAIAKKFAWTDGDKHSYIPDIKEQMQDWTPHEWVVKAMEKAYTQGLEDAVSIHKEKLK